LLRKELKEGRLSGHIYSEKIIKQLDCKHEEYTVDPNTEKYLQRDTLSGVLLGMFTAHWFQPKEDYIKAIATCDRCGIQFYVECSYTNQSQWKNYEEKTIINRGKWQIVYETVDDRKMVISYV
jgi:hypothetical protein